MSVVACLSLLSGIVIGLRFNVRLLLLLCVAAVATGVIGPLSGYTSASTSLLTTVVTVIALQVGYFVAVVIGAMQLTDEPVASYAETPAKSASRDAAKARRT